VQVGVDLGWWGYVSTRLKLHLKQEFGDHLMKLLSVTDGCVAAGMIYPTYWRMAGLYPKHVTTVSPSLYPFCVSKESGCQPSGFYKFWLPDRVIQSLVLENPVQKLAFLDIVKPSGSLG
jgi:hypothetical protein